MGEALRAVDYRPPSEICFERADLKARLLNNPVALWCAENIEDKKEKHPVPALHLDFYDMFLLSDEKKKVVKAPRSFAKSTICIRNFVTYLCCEHRVLKMMGDDAPVYPHDCIMVTGANGKQAKKWLGKIKTLLRSSAIVERYGDIFSTNPEHQNNQDEFWTRDGVQVVAYGAGYSFRGERPSLFIGDDLDDDEAVRSDEQIEKIVDWFDKAVINMMDETYSEVFIIGTTIEEITLLEHISEMSTFTTYHYGAYLRDPETGEFRMERGWESWRSKWSHERLTEKIGEIGMRNFMSEFMNEPMPSKNPLFEREWFREYDPSSEEFSKILNNGVTTFLTCDPAISQQDGADFSAIVTISLSFLHGHMRVYMRTGGVKQGHWTPARTVDQIVTKYDDFYASKVGVESNAYQEALAYWVEEYMDNQHRTIKVKRLKASKDKGTRAREVSPVCERREVYYDPNDKYQVAVINQLVRFKSGVKNMKKDLMDAFVWGLKMAMEHNHKWKKKTGGKKIMKEKVFKNLNRR